MDLIDRTKYRKDLLAAYDDVSMEFDVLDRQPTVQAIPLDKIKEAREEMDKLASHKVRPISFDQSVAIDMCIGILDKLMAESEEGEEQ